MKLMREQMAAQNAQFEQQQTFQQELMKQNEKLKGKTCMSELTSTQRQKILKERHVEHFKEKSTRRSSSKDRCAFHNDMGHKTEDCFTLKDAIEEAVRKGRLIKFMYRGISYQGQSLHSDPKGQQKVKDGNDLMVVTVTIAGFGVRRILVDSGSTVEEQALSKASPPYGFANHPIEVKGSITLPFTLEDDEHTTTEYVQFFAVDHPMAYNAIFIHLIMRTTKMVVAKFCMKIKFSTRTGIRLNGLTNGGRA
ncbi:hypothetical protein J1N35_019482 [Gossypium stocksii]|uniref:Uncharacterized protein n=1 Tax=Gossypium stocksii TaxID=47602 RepID=A0A9D3VT06_9ROSI|nr:hypothetical protein J1N35_019482 [Gossypium stocksii]